MSYLIGSLGLLVLAAVYVGLGLADRGRKGCGGCALRESAGTCASDCPSEDGTNAIDHPARGSREGGAVP